MEKQYWLQRVLVRGARDEETAMRVRNTMMRCSLPATYRLPELEKTSDELQMIHDAFGAMQAVLADVGLPPRFVTPERVHVLGDDAFKKGFGEKVIGKTSYGHVYLMRNSLQPMSFMHVLTHELAHAAGDKAIEITVPKDDCDLEYMRLWRVGLAVAPSFSRKMFCFHGLNEAVTEIIAKRARQHLVARACASGTGIARAFLAEGSYREQVALVRRIIDDVAATSGTPPSRLTDLLCGDYFSGTNRFLHLLSRKRRGAVKLLYAMGAASPDVIPVAIALGYDDFARSVAAAQ